VLKVLVLSGVIDVHGLCVRFVGRGFVRLAE
jgi:hypothetical protein